MQLADLGADVIKIENPEGGDPARQVGPYLNPRHADDSIYFQSFNRNKRSVALNLRTEEGRRALQRLAATADVVFNNLRGDLPARLGLDYASLASANPVIVCVSCSGYGSDPRWAAEPAYDYLFQARTGMMSLTGEPDAPPAKAGISIIDMVGGLVSAIGILSAVLAARRDGRGRDVEISLYGSALSLLNYVAAWTLNTDWRGGKLPRSQHPSLMPTGVYTCRDGWIMIMCLKPRFFARLAEALGRTDLLQDPRFATPAARMEHREQLTRILDAEFATDTATAWCERLSGKVPASPVHDLRRALEDPWIAANQMLWEVAHPDFGSLVEIGSPIRMAGAHRTRQERGPFLGEHTEELLRAAGYDDASLARLREATPS